MCKPPSPIRHSCLGVLRVSVLLYPVSNSRGRGTTQGCPQSSPKWPTHAAGREGEEGVAEREEEMSFRYSNTLIKAFRELVKGEEVKKRLAAMTVKGRYKGCTVTYTGCGRITSLELDED
eukprot:Sspe_Gene.16093::Locus_5660_Transcript_2_2_Confidence_0.750_Length_1421::g.16093::m.16093